MKKMKIGLSLFAAVLLTVLFSCEEPYLDAPNIPRDENSGSSRSVEAPSGLTATHGEYRSITISWDPKPGAELYYMYRANSPLDVFVRCGETTATQFEFKVSPGATVYYKVSSVSQSNTESSISGFVRGTSLAQPVISDITDINEASATVTWYMDNVYEDTYKSSLLYTVYCYNGSSLVSQLSLDGEALNENKARFDNLNPNTKYVYQVEAYLRGNQNASEKSEIVDAATARRMRPASPVNLRASRGASAEKIEVAFELPDFVDISLGENKFETKSVYFVISKRRYSESGNNPYETVCSYFGSVSNTDLHREKSFNDYVPGATVAWTDNSVTRGVEYEYQVQAYVDESQKVISSDSSKASKKGWALSEANLDFIRVNNKVRVDYTLAGDAYESAQLPLVFDFDEKGIRYSYSLIENINPIDIDELPADKDPYDPDGPIVRYPIPLTYEYNDIKNYIAQMNFTQKTTASSPGRGLYSYKVKINLNSEEVYEVETNEVEVSETTDPIVVDDFSVQDGYKDKFVINWSGRENYKYILYVSDNKTIGFTQIHDQAPVSGNYTNNSFSFTYEDSITPGVTKYFAIRPLRTVSNREKKGQMEYTDAARTLGVPAISLSGGASYSNITLTWPRTQKADVYRIKYWYAGEAVITKTERNLVAVDGTINYTFSPFENNSVDVAKAGKEIQIEVEALNESLGAAVGEEISTTSNEVATRLVGPAELAPTASKATSPMQIDVSWNRVTGASGYYVYRRQFDIDGNVQEGNDDDVIVYWLPQASADASVPITGKKLVLDSLNAKTDTTVVSARASISGSRYTLQDDYMDDGDYYGNNSTKDYSRHASKYRDQQNDMAQGYSYRYYIVPAINGDWLDAIDFTYVKDTLSNKNKGLSSYTIREGSKTITYTNSAAFADFEKEGFTIGFAQNVTATKGTYASTGNLNNGIRITWSPSAKLGSVAGFNPQYTVYRRLEGDDTWVPRDSSTNLYFVDTPPENERGRAYEYVVGIANGSANGSEPNKSKRFIDGCKLIKDGKNRPNYLGFMQGYVKVASVTKGGDAALNAIFGERVTWEAAGIKNNVSADTNWGIDGYTIYVMNRNIDAQWHIAADDINDFSNIQVNQSYVLTPNNTPSFAANNNPTGSKDIGTHTRNLLFVLRDYKHFYKVRTYVTDVREDAEVKIYGPDPAWDYEYRYGTTQAAHIDASSRMENDFVKWGARQINKSEFITIASLYFARGQDRAIGTGTWPIEDKTGNASANWGGSGKMVADYTYNWIPSYTHWEFKFEEYKDDLQARTGDWMTFITLNGKAWARCGAVNTRPQRYTENGRGWIDVRGPWDTPHLYTGKIMFGTGGDDAGTNLRWGENANNIAVEYPVGAARENITFTGSNTALDFTNQSNNGRLNTSYWW